MKYLYSELWNADPNDKEAETNWEKQSNLAWDDYKTVVHRLPRNFVKVYEYDGFHDYIIKSFTVEMNTLKRRPKYNGVLRLANYDGTMEILIILCHVFSVKTDFAFEKGWEPEWLYSEILPVDDRLISLEIYATSGTIYVEFEKLIFKKTAIKL